MRLTNRGFSLLELMLVLGIAGIITAFAFSLTSSLRGMSKIAVSRQRMETVRDSMRSYYDGHDAMPVAGSSPANSVPSVVLGLEAKYRQDAWGQFFYYDPNDAANIGDVQVNGSTVAGILISYGSNQKMDATSSGAAPKIYTSGKDDILLPVSVNDKAVAKARADLQILQGGVHAFDKVFAGVNNDGDYTGSIGSTAQPLIDEDGCVADSGTGCPPNGNNDPSCGVASLNSFSSYSSCTTGASAFSFIKAQYGLVLSNASGNDPWGNPYHWDSGKEKFYSYGPDGATTTADDIYP
ncbi:MAG: type II secretion system protein [Deltaproteobacteria bacterium]|nr:type II secretion system protein [Deltaproteobacteria bacterium]